MRHAPRRLCWAFECQPAFRGKLGLLAANSTTPYTVSFVNLPYGPTEPYFNQSWVLPDFEPVK